MKKFLQVAILVLVFMSYDISMGTVARAVEPNPLCPETGEMTYVEFLAARTLGSVSHTLTVSEETGLATVVVNNATGCKIPISLSVYKVFDQVLSHQEFFAGTGLVDVSVPPSTTFTAGSPSCMAQVDLWYGLAPETLSDTTNYGDPTQPAIVLDWKFVHGNDGGTGQGYFSAVGTPFCQHTTPPVDVCSNIAGNQSVVPEGMTESGGICTTPTPPSGGGSSGGGGYVQCANSRDDDGDGLIDANDPGCHVGDNLLNAYVPSDSNEINGEVLGAQTFVPLTPLIPKVLAAKVEVGLPRTGAGGNATSNIIMLVTSGLASIFGLMYLIRRYRSLNNNEVNEEVLSVQTFAPLMPLMALMPFMSQVFASLEPILLLPDPPPILDLLYLRRKYREV